MNRRYIAAAVALTVSALAGTSANASTVVVPMGSADTFVELASVDVAGAPVDGIDFGSVRSFASTDVDTRYNPLGGGKPFAIAKVGLPDGSEQSVRSDGDGGQDGTTVPLAGVGSVTVGSLRALAGEESASSLVNAVGGELDAVIAGLKARAAGVNAVVDATGSSTTNGAVIEQVSVGLDDVLPEELLEQLPLETLLGIVDGLGLPIDLGDLEDAADQVRDLQATVEDVVETHAGVLAAEDAVDDATVDLRKAEKALADAEAVRREVEDTLNGLLKTYGAQSHVGGIIDDVEGVIGDIEDTVDDVEDTVDDTVDDVEDTVDDVIGDGGNDNDDNGTPDAIDRQRRRLADAVAGVEAAEQALAAAEGALELAQAELAELVEILEALLAMLSGLVEQALELDVEGLYAAVLEGFQGVELIGLDRLAVGINTVADAVTSKASTLCEVSGVRILGEAQPVSDCAALDATVEDIEQRLDEVIALLPVQGVVPTDVVSVSGPRMSTSPDGYTADGYRIASAKIQGLALTVQSVALSQVTDGLVSQIVDIVDDALTTVEELAGTDLPLADVEAALEALLAQLETLPTGELLRDVRTPEINVTAMDVASRSTFRAAGSGVDSVPIGGSTTTGSDPVSPAGNLPHTGGGVGAALALLAAGGAVWTAVRPRNRVTRG